MAVSCGAPSLALTADASCEERCRLWQSLQGAQCPQLSPHLPLRSLGRGQAPTGTVNVLGEKVLV